MNAAEALAGLELRVPVESAGAAAGRRRSTGTTWSGARGRTADGATVGTVADVEGTLAGSRLVVQGDRGEVLIPLVAEICTAIDPAARRIVIDAAGRAARAERTASS